MTPDERATEVIAPLAKMAAHGRPVPLGMLLETLSADIAAAITAAVEAERDACREKDAEIERLRAENAELRAKLAAADIEAMQGATMTTATNLTGAALDAAVENALGGDAIAVDLPRPFSRDVKLAMGLLLPERAMIDVCERRIVVRHRSGAVGSAKFAEFPDAADDERRAWALATAICRAFLSAKS